MTVTVTLPDDGTDKYVRFGDVDVEHNDGALDVYRGDAKQTQLCLRRVDRRGRRPKEVQEAWLLGLIEPPVARGDVFPGVRCRLAGKSFVLALPP